MKLHRWRKRVPISRVMVTLASTSLALVLFSATVYASVIPSVLAGTVTDLPFTGERADQAGEDSSASGSGGSSTDQTVSEDQVLGEGLADAMSSISTALLGSPTFGSLQSLIVDAPDQVETSSGEGASSQPSATAPSQSGSQGVAPQPAVEAATEAAIHDHLVQLYVELPSWYNQVCEGYNNLYATIYSEDPSVTHAHCAPTKPHALQAAIDQKRISVFSGGPTIPTDSKWCSAAQELTALYNNLVNACSPLWETDGFLRQSAVSHLKRYLDSDGKISELAIFERNYPNVRL